MPRVRKDIQDLARYSRATRFDEKYPYFPNLLDGQVHELAQGRDFDVQIETLRAGVKEWAKKNGVDLLVRTEGEDKLLVQVRKAAPKARTVRRKGGSKR